MSCLRQSLEVELSLEENMRQLQQAAHSNIASPGSLVTD
jgi:hypothetical protein